MCLFWLVAFLFLLMPPHTLVDLVETPAQRFAKVDMNHFEKSQHRSCVDSDRRPQFCSPDFINVAYNLSVEVSPPEATCGVRKPNKYCFQTGNGGLQVNRTCSVCDNRIPSQAHPPSLLTDFNRPDKDTWWQSVTMEEGVHKHRVNLTLRMGKAYDIAYVRLKFASPMPESLVIYKRTAPGDPWTPWQYYSGSCRATFGLTEKAPILPGNEEMAQCTREFSDISPLSGGNIAFPTLEGRPSAVNFGESEALHRWVTATDIMISLVRLNTFGDEVFHSVLVLRTYFYAISDFAVGGRCKCNGHANQCVKSTGGGEQQLVCDCQHNTAGVDCQECAPFYVDRPWRPATSTEANECLPCSCNGLSNRCFFDAQLYEQTGHGGHCIDCAGNTQGLHCESCMPNHWRYPGELYCRPCQCNEIGSVDGQCNGDGQCQCKPGVGGQFCDRCENGFYEFTSSGCKDCRCEVSGSFNNTPNCSPSTGSCACKKNVEGKRCQGCKPGYFLLSAQNPFGCWPCFCFGHSSVCSTADGFYSVNISSDLSAADQDGFGFDGWTAKTIDGKSIEVNFDVSKQAISVVQQCDKTVFFLPPSKFLGDQRFAYGQSMRFSFRKLSPYASWSSMDLQLVGANGRVLSLPLGAQGNAMPSDRIQHYHFRVHADPALQWSPQLREIDFIGVLSNLTEIRLRGTFARGDVGYLSHFSLGSAVQGHLMPAADWVEQCQCPAAFAGQFCQFCATGFKRAQPLGGPLTKCVPCQCNGHAQQCDPESGACHCLDNTAGDTCERCARGFFGDALMGTAVDCQPCNCPGGGACLQLEDGQLLCTECPDGYTGPRCEYCTEDHFGDPRRSQPCLPCECSGNVDPNAIGQCDPLTGECLRCVHHTGGPHCERCLAGFWGNATAEPRGSQHCQPCDCFAPGTQGGANGKQCAQADGQCPCRTNVVGRRCDSCAIGFFNISSGLGCQPCECDPLGTRQLDDTDAGQQCHPHTGQCRCKEGVIGLKCDQCAANHFGFGETVGCAACVCHPVGAENSECDIRNGQCLCRDWVEGRKCDRCAENHHDLASGCPPCDDCYTLIQTRKDGINQSMGDLASQLDDFRALPIPPNEMASLNLSVEALFAQLDGFRQRLAQQQDSNLATQFHEARQQLELAFSHLNTSNAASHNLETELARLEAAMAKRTQQRVTTESEIDRALGQLRSVGGQKLGELQRILQQSSHRQAGPSLKLAVDEALELVKKQEQRLAQLRDLAKEVAEKSAQALAEAKEIGSSGNSSSSSSELAKLGVEVAATAKHLKLVDDLAKQVSAEVKKDGDEAALLLSNVRQIGLPPKNQSEAINQTLAELRAQAKEVGQQLAEAKAKRLELEQKADKELARSRQELARAKKEWEEVQREFELVSQLDTRANKAVETVADAVKEAEKVELLLNSQNPEEMALWQEVYETQTAGSGQLDREVASTVRRMAILERKLQKVQKKANRALEMALKAEERAESVAKPLRELDANVEELQRTIVALSAQMGELEANIEVEEGNVQDRLEEANEQAQKMDNTLRGAASAEQSAQSLAVNLAKDEEMLALLVERLNTNVSLLDVKDLDLWEAELVKWENSSYTEDLEPSKEQVRRLTDEKKQLKSQISMLENELGQLNGIIRSLPPTNKCFNVIQIEQNGH